jgi:hypothetical protein
MRDRFPELGMNRSHCREMSWAESVLYVYVGSGQPIPMTDLLNRTFPMDRSNTSARRSHTRRGGPRGPGYGGSRADTGLGDGERSGNGCGNGEHLGS